MSDVNTVLFDLDDTLLKYERPGSAVLDIAFERAGVDPFFTAADYYQVYDDHLDESDDIADLRARAFARLAHERGREPERGRAVAAAYASERDQSRVVTYEGAHDTLAHLSDDYALGLVTNGDPEMQDEKLRGAALTDYFDTVVHGGSDAPSKPAPDGFHLALDRLDATAERAVHVGNSLATDVPGALAAGVQSVWLDVDGTSDPDPRPDYVVESLYELRTRPWRS